MPTPRGPLLFDAAFEKGASEIFGEAGASEYDAPPPPLKRKRGEAPVLDNASKKARRPSGPPPAPAILPYCDSKISHQSRSLEPLDRDANPNEAQPVAELHVLSKGQADHALHFDKRYLSSLNLSTDTRMDVPIDLTGKVIREGEYPCASGGFADVWKGEWCDVDGKRNVMDIKDLSCVFSLQILFFRRLLSKSSELTRMTLSKN